VDDVVAVVTDLFFQSRISAAARHLGIRIRYVSPSEAADTPHPFRAALVDLDAGGDVTRAIAALRAAADGPIVAFGPHVDTDRRKAARTSGADRVLAKSKFVTELPHILAEAATRE
jgi:CheY-like chemotaxis protein